MYMTLMNWKHWKCISFQIQLFSGKHVNKPTIMYVPLANTVVY